MLSVNRRIYDWLDERLRISEVIARGQAKQVPDHHYSVFHYLGSATAFLLVVQVVSGIMLALYYRPSAAEAHDSLAHLITNVPFGDLVRSVHAWAGDLMIGVLIAHMFSMWILGAYHKPRELTWLLGCLLLGVGVTLGFTGHLLPWSELSYSTSRVGTDIAGSVPWVGEGLRDFLRAGEHVTGLTLTRFYGFHVALLPATAFVLVLAHVGLVQMQGFSVPKAFRNKDVPTVSFFPVALLRSAFWWLLLLGIVVSLATFFPGELGLEADPFKPAPADIKPQWYFLFVFQTLKLLPAEIAGIGGDVIGIVGFLIAYVWVVLIPFLDRRDRAIYPIAGWVALIFFVGFTVYGWLD